MLERGYNKNLASGIIAASGTLAVMIPPSGLMVIYALITEEPLGPLLIAGFIPGIFWAYVASYTELLGGLFLILGIETRGAAALLLILIVVAGLKVHLKKGFFLSKGGFEYTFVIATVCFALIFLGPGNFVILK